jgi:transcriptional regulator with XRE-family HTH domain
MAETGQATGPDAALPFQRFFIKLLRERGWSLREAGAAIGVAGPNVWAYVQGLNTPHEDIQERIARAADVDVARVAGLVWEQKKLRRAQLAQRRAARGAEREHQPETPASPWTSVEALIGTVEGPEDWAAEHDHYLYGVAKRRRTPRR